ncbi:MAG TPA: secretin N-terminal domain-containing protein, partial [Planctomycetota bacterium]|nr:secretin N-terminal domain-containing protein [Planctomycetota bacterium]
MVRWTTVLALCSALLVFAPPARSQETPAAPEKRLDFKFRDASVERVLEYVCKQMGWTMVKSPSAKLEGTVTAYNESLVPEGQVVDFLNTSLQNAKLQVILLERTLKVVTEEEAKKGAYNISVGDDPTKIPINEAIWTWVFPLRNLNVDEVEKKLAEVVKGDLQAVSYSPYSNSVIMTGRNSAIYRAARILKIIDVQAPDKLEVRLFKLRHADAQETAKILNDVFKKPEASTGRGGNPWQQMAEMMGGGGQRNQGPQPRALASEMLRITADLRTNAVIATATKDNLDMLERILKQLDGESAEAVRLKLYPLRYADAKGVADLITKVYEDEAAQSRQANRNQRNIPIWMGGAPQVGADPTGATREVRAVADIRSNSVVVAANELNLKVVDDLVASLDRQLTDILRIKVYELKNADPTQMVTMLREMFRPQITATQQAGRPQQQQQQGNQNPFMFGNRSGGGASSGLLSPSQEMEIGSDPRTRSVIVKASEDYIAVIDEIVEQLDRNPTESMETHVIGLRHGDAAALAQVIRDLLRGGTGTTGNRTTPTNNNQARNANNNQQRPSTRQGGNNATRNLGPLQDQDMPAPTQEPAPNGDPEQDRRAIEGQADVQADAATNSLVIRTSPRNLDAIRSIIQNLDRPRPQVLIKVLIAEVTLDKDTRYGVEGFWENKFRINGDLHTQKYGTDFNLPTQGLAALITGDEMSAALNAFSEDGKLKVLATPRVLVLDNQTANVNVGKEVPRITNSTINDATGNIQNTVQYESIGIMLDVTPHINFDGLVTMDVHPEISDIAPASESVILSPGVLSPTFNVNSADTTVAVRTGQTVVIGGLIRESETDTVTKVPILGDIPLIGFFFSNTIKERVQRELMIFLTPIVAFTAAQLEELTELEKAKLKLIDDGDIDDAGDRWLQKIRE